MDDNNPNKQTANCPASKRVARGDAVRRLLVEDYSQKSAFPIGDGEFPATLIIGPALGGPQREIGSKFRLESDCSSYR